MEENNETSLHIALFPWLAMGHLIPFFNLSKRLAQKGHKISFLSTPKNLTKLAKIPLHLSPLLNLVPLPFPNLPNLPPNAESSADLPYNKQPLLKQAHDLLEPSIAAFLEASKPDWIIYDFASFWLPPLAAKLGVSRVFFCLFTAACMDFIGPPSGVAPEWVPFETSVVFRVYEMGKYVENVAQVYVTDTVRIGLTVVDSEFVAVRTRPEFEPEWLCLLGELYRKPVVPVGVLPPVIEEETGDEERWVRVKEWLDKWKANSVIYVALGTEASLTRDELSELGLGLEKSELPFFWVLKNPPGSTQPALEILPDGFLERVKDRGIVWVDWAPQVRILSHDSVGVFLTHCGWNSVIEGLGFGRVLVLLPFVNDQGLNARQLGTSWILDGSFTSDSVAKTVRLAMVDESGESLRVKAREIKGLFGDRDSNDRYLNEFVTLLKEKRNQS
ncbi:hypothetical protein UlMin_036163 [Ulmus minor]